MRWKLLLLFMMFLLIVNIEAKTLSTPEGKLVNEFEDGDSTIEAGDDDEFYINVPKNVDLVNATLDIEGNDIENIRIKIDNKILFENSTFNGELTLDLINNVSTSCDPICRWKLDIKTDDEFTIKNLLVNYTFTQTPLFTRYIQDVKWSGGTKLEALDLDDYFYGDDITYKNRTDKEQSIEHISIEIDSSHEVNLIAEPGWQGTGYIYFVADDDSHTAKSNEIKLTVGSGQEESKPFQFSPTESTLTITKGTQQTFGVSGSGNFSVDWYLNNNLTEESSFTYTFDPLEIGVYTIEAKVGSTRKQWSISVLEPEIIEPDLSGFIQTEVPVCGNKIREENEDCENCPEDVKCASNAKCINGKCILTEKKTGLKWVIWSLIGFSLVIILTIVIIILVKKGKLRLPRFGLTNIFKKKQEKEVIEEKPKEDLSALKDYLTTSLKKGHNRQDLINAALKQGWTREQIDKILKEQKQPITKKEILPPELQPLKNYLISNLKKGHNRQDLINAAIKIGWTREQIDKVLKCI